MRFYKIALFVFILYAFGGIIASHASSMGMSAGLYAGQLDDATVQKAANAKILTTLGSVSGTDPISAALGWFYQQIGSIASTLFSVAFPLIEPLAWLPFYMIWIGIPADITWAIWGILMVIEAVGFYEFFTGREMEK